MVLLVEGEKIVINNYNHLRTPQDVLEYIERLGGICGEATIAALMGINVRDVFSVWGIGEENFKGWTTQKEMRVILDRLGYNVKQKRVKDKYRLPNSDFAIIRVSFGNPNQFWLETASVSHYIAIRKFQQGWYVYDSAINLFDGKPINGIWIEKSEYYKVMEEQNMFITSYLEIIRKIEGNMLKVENNGKNNT